MPVRYFSAQNGKITQYRITRIWQNNDGKIDEFLKIFTKPVGDKKYSLMGLEESQLQHIINQMIPKPVADLFFLTVRKFKIWQSMDTRTYT